MNFKLEDPLKKYAQLDLEPFISKEVVNLHLQLHKKYYDKTTSVLSNLLFQRWSLNELLSYASGQIYNNAAQYWYHEKYWSNLTTTAPPIGPETTKLINKSYGSLENFKNSFFSSALQHFGSGWYVCGFNRHYPLALRSYTFKNAETPMKKDIIPIAVIDLFEHAYLQQHGSNKKKYLENVWQLLNWEELERRIIEHQSDWKEFKSWH